mmetsp:Transcript_1973/g.3589  ORF Transcript_1973/g.3589 Transcript_1973/m.3589 type:complete len:101 (-) Transcript_1973:265-567(-)
MHTYILYLRYGVKSTDICHEYGHCSSFLEQASSIDIICFVKPFRMQLSKAFDNVIRVLGSLTVSMEKVNVNDSPQDGCILGIELYDGMDDGTPDGKPLGS